MADDNNDAAPLLVLAAEIAEEEAEQQDMMMMIARIAAAEIMDLEEGQGLDCGDTWVPITVFINEYHQMGDPCFKMHFRMSRTVFEELVKTVHDHLKQNGKLQRERTPFADIMLMIVWLMATPDTFRSVALRFGVRPSVLHYFYTYVIEAFRELSAQYIVWPDEAERERIKGSFLRASGFPGIIGSIDGTHVEITAPLQDAAQYVNRHDKYSINVQAVVDNNLLVRHVHVGEVGSMHDQRVFRRSPLYEPCLRREDHRLFNDDEHLVGDGAYTLTDFMMIPFANNGHLTPNQNNFNKRLSQARVRVENTFGLAKGKWRRLKSLAARNQAYVVDYITGAFFLHNFLILNGEPMLEEEDLIAPIGDNQVLGNEDVFMEDGNELEDLEVAAGIRGAEKRMFIMDYILPNDE